MSDQAVNVRVVAQTGELNKGMAEAPRIVEQAVQRMRGAFSTLRQETAKTLSDMQGDVTNSVRGMAGSFGGLVDVLGTTKGGFLALAAVVAAVGFSKVVIATAEATEGLMDTARALGITTNEASVLRAALEDLGAEPGEFQAAAKGLSRQLKENEEDLNKLGLTTRDAAGNFRSMTDLVVDGIAVLGTYAEGADRNIASQAMFGRGIDASSRLLLLNRDVIEENRAAVQELGLEVGENSVAAWREFDAAGDRAALSLKGVGRAVGQTLMPVMTDLVRLFNAVMPAAIVVVKGALAGLTTAFLVVKNGVVVLWETLKSVIFSLAEPIRGLVEAIFKAMTGDFAGAREAIKGIGTNIAARWTMSMDEMVSSSEETARKVKSLFMDDTEAGDPGGAKGTKAVPKLGKEPKERVVKDKAEVDKSQMAVYLAELEQEKLVQAQRDALREYDKSQELAFWQAKLQGTDVVEKDRLTILTRTAKLEVEILRDKARQGVALNAEQRKAAEARALASVEMASIEAKGAYDARAISYEELLALELKFEEQRFQIRLSALQAQKLLIDPQRDPVAYAQLLSQIEALDQQYQARRLQLQISAMQEAGAPMRAMFETMEQSFGSALEGMILRTQTWRQALSGVFRSTYQAFVQEMVTKPLAQMAMRFLRETTLYKALMGMQVSTQATGSAAVAGIKAGETTAVVAGNAAQAATGAAASQAPIPIIGPGLAIAAAAAMFAFALGFGGKRSVPSARGGFDIPAGVNPMTQLHEREMVLPAQQADVIRGMADGGAGAGSGSPVHIHGSPDDTVKLRDLGRALKRLNRDFVFVGQR